MVVMNPYFQHGDGIGNASEKYLYEDLIIEGLKIYGNLVYYMPRDIVNRDLVLGEDVNSKSVSYTHLTLQTTPYV